jgi:hypothetical protein
MVVDVLSIPYYLFHKEIRTLGIGLPKNDVAADT